MASLAKQLSLLLFFLVFGVLALSAQLTVTGGQTPQQLVNNLAGPGIQVFNVTMNCPGNANGTFDGSNTNLNINSGVLLTSGDLSNAALPQTSGSITTDNNSAGDLDLDILSGVPTFDACALEFDFVSRCDTISIGYVFASDEYDEYVCASVNDAFGFFVTGTGLNNVNIARIPGTTTPVAINSVNNGTVGINGTPGSPGCNLTNSAFYLSNALGITHEYDGQTVRLEAKTWVMPCDTYHVKLVVADGGDGVFDSGVFLEENGIRCTSAELEINTTFANGSGYLVEGCNDAELSFVRNNNLSQGITVKYIIGGTGINGLDYTQIADSIVFAPGQDTVFLNVSAFDDGLIEGVENLFIIVSDTVCSSILSDTAEILIVDPPIADFVFSNACVGIPVIFTDLSSFPPGMITAWNWDFGDATPTSSLQNPIHAYASGTYTVTLIATTAEGCEDTTSQIITVLDPPTANWSFQGQCFGQTTVFTDLSTAAPGDVITGWVWDLGDGNTSMVQSPNHVYGLDGTYTVSLIVTNQNGCADTLSQSVVIHPKPLTDFTFSDVCDGNPVSFQEVTFLNSGSLVLWDWDLGDANTQNIAQFDHVYATPGTYTVVLQVESDQGCRDTATHDVVVHPKPVAEFTWNNVCDGEVVQFDDQSSISGGSITGYDFDLDDGNSSIQANFTHIYAGPGTYAVELEITSDQGCRDTIVHDVVVAPKPVADFSFADVCDGNAVNFQDLTTLSAGNLTSHTWDLGDGNVQTQASFNHLYTAPGTYTVVLIVTTDQGCGDTIEQDVVVHPNSVVDFEASFACLGDTSFFTDLSTILTGTIATYDWDFGDGDFSSDQNPFHIYASAGTYTATLTLTSDQGCVTSLSIPVILPPGPPAPLPINDTVCTGFDAYLSAVPPSVPGTINWYYAANSTTPFHTGNALDLGPITENEVYYLDYISDEGCLSERVWILAAANIPPQVPIEVSDLEVEIPNAIVEFTSDPPPMVVGQLWTFGDGNTSTQVSPVHQYSLPGVYDVSYWLIDENGCERYYAWNQYITVTEQVYVWAPNAFTPNGDGTNDTYSVTTRLITDFNITIYDRWGKLLYESDNMGFAWSGTGVDGQPLPEGVYPFVINAIDFLGRPVKTSGTITLYR